MWSSNSNFNFCFYFLKDYDFPKYSSRHAIQKSFLFFIINMTFTLSIEFYFYVYFHYSKTEPELNDHLYIYIFLFIMQIFSIFRKRYLWKNLQAHARKRKTQWKKFPPSDTNENLVKNLKFQIILNKNWNRNNNNWEKNRNKTSF